MNFEIYEKTSGNGNQFWKMIKGNQLVPVKKIGGCWRQVGLTPADYDEKVFSFHELG